MSDINQLLRQRHQILALSLITFLLWQGGWLWVDTSAPTGTTGLIANGAYGLGALGWIASSLLLVVFQRRVRAHDQHNVLEDEWHRHVRLKTFTSAFIGLAGLVVLAFTWTRFHPLSGDLISRLLLIASVVLPIGLFLYFQSESED